MSAAVAVPGVLGALGLLQQGQANKNQKHALDSQRGLAQQQQQLFGQGSPYYAPILQYLAQNAGIGLPSTPGIGGSAGVPGHPQMGFGHPSPTMGQGSGALQDSQLGIWNNPTDQLRMAQAQEQVNHLRDSGANNLAFRFNQQGIGGGTLASALASNQNQADQSLAGFRRQLAIDAPHEQMQRVGSLLGALNPALSAGGQASGTYGFQGGLYGQQAGQAGNAMGNALQNYMMWQVMQKQRPGGGVSPGDIHFPSTVFGDY